MNLFSCFRNVKIICHDRNPNCMFVKLNNDNLLLNNFWEEIDDGYHCTTKDIITHKCGFSISVGELWQQSRKPVRWLQWKE